MGLVGCGKIAEKHLEALASFRNDLELVALCDRDPSRMQTLLQRAGLSSSDLACYSDLKPLLQREDLDLVVIATSSGSHAPLAMQLLQAGKHLLVEKPLALSLEEARRVTEEARRRGLVFGVSLQTRYLSQVQAIKAAVDEGRFGKVFQGAVSFRWHRDAEYYRASPWRGTWAGDGGVLMNQGIHYIDLLQWLMGPVSSVYGEIGTFVHPIETEDCAVAVLRFQSGAIGLIEGTTGIYPQNLQTSLSLFGIDGTVILEGERLDRFAHWRFKDQDAKAQAELPRIEPISFKPLYQDFIQAIRAGGTPLVTASSALHSLEVVLAIYQSALEQRPVSLPVGQFETRDMLKAKTDRNGRDHHD